MNVILITIDAFRADYTGCIGGNWITPNIDRLAKESMIFEKAYSTGPKTPFSFPAILCSRFRSMQQTDHIPNKTPTVAEVFKREGFHTMAMQGGNPYLSRFFNYNRGFVLFLDYLFPSYMSEKEKKKRTLEDLWKRSTPSFTERFFSYLSHKTPHIECKQIVSDAKKNIKDYIEEDFFVWLHFMDTHTPFIPKKQLLKSKNEYNYSFLTYSSDLYKHNKLYSVSKDNKRYKFDANTLTSLKQFYSCCIQYVDTAIGDLISFLKRYQIYDDTILIITSDHGECLGDHGKIGHPPNELWNALIHVPLIIKDINQITAKRIKKPVSHVDLFPSIMERIGIRYPSEFSGKNVLFNGVYKPVFSYGIDLNGQVVSCIYKKWKYIWHNGNSTEKLYNLEEDPLEKFNLLLNYSNESIRKKMKSYVRNFLYWSSYEKNIIDSEHTCAN